ncbi:hypothetical protein PR048_009083 [Dryococelus australis]|uniref:DUF4371 domain-containing protein n=1 Tax=Dryococelus australis TaxID=614101 RepID=A0ABQ9I0R7_9NEOP|nr:hypothetical protein PR048_009083 [Dryococelus australis]
MGKRVFVYGFRREAAMYLVRASDIGNERIQHLSSLRNETKTGKIIKQCTIKMAKSFGDDKLAKNFKTVSLSHQTVSRKTAEISKQLDAQLSKEIVQSKYFSVALDESADIIDVCQLLIFVKTVDEQFSVKEELLNLVQLHTSAKGSDIYSALVSVVEKCGRFSKCSCLVTDSAKCMTSKNTGLVGLLRKNYVNMPVLHCIFHQAVLCSKLVKMNDVMKDVTRIVKLIRSDNRAQMEFLKELSAEFHDIPLHSEIRWLSAGTTLTAFFLSEKELLSS